MHDFKGRWRIKWMETWDQDYVDLIESGYFKFEDDGLGEFVFGAVKGWVDVRVSSGKPYLEYSWQGVSEGDEYCGRGWFDFPTPDIGHGSFYIHCGDESKIEIERET